jgi:hypothetical protein
LSNSAHPNDRASHGALYIPALKDEIFRAISDKNHGPDQNKGLDIEHQASHLFVRLFQKDRGVLAVPVGPADSYYLAALAMRPLRQATPWLGDPGILMLLKLTVQRMSAAQNVKQ